jgi:3-deoxy-D-manno-octulosonic-acid transferase
MYQIGFFIYVSIFRLVALFHKKANKMVQGHKKTWIQLSKNIDRDKPWLWFHASSLGEFEQGRPVMERIRAAHPEYKILLTFYSPSGFEVRKNYAGADLICYLPFDTLWNVKRFLRLSQPKMAFFIKYEFWPNYLRQLRKREIPAYLISGIFRPDQLFFKKYGFFYRGLLESFNHIFVQNKESQKLLKSIGRKKDVSITGDTRYDRVLEIKAASKKLPLVENYWQKIGNEKILIAGSSWQKDEELILPYFNEHLELKLLIAPHEIDEGHLLDIESKLTRPSIRYSKATPEQVATCDCLILDCFGLLSSAYRYGDIAYIGGGFGAGIHNTLEAAVYNIPVLFGPNFEKFQEAKELIQTGGGYSIDTYEQLANHLDTWILDDDTRTRTGKIAGEMVKKGSGGSKIVLMTLPL